MRASYRSALFVGRRHVELREFVANGWWPRIETMVRSSRIDLPEPADLSLALNQLFGEFKPQARQISVIVSDACCRSLVAPRLQGAANLGEIEAALRMKFQKESGEEDLSWALEVQMAPFSRRDLVVGMPNRMLEALRGSAAGRDLRLSSIRPLWVVCAEETRFLGRGALSWLLAGDADTRTLALFQGSRCLGVRTSSSRAQTLTPAQLIAREGLLFDAPGPVESGVIWGEGFVQDAAPRSAPGFSLAGWPVVWAGKLAVQAKGRVA